MKILVLGASGQLGRCIEHVAQGSTDHYHFATRETLDLSDTSAIEQFATREGIEVIINCAAYSIEYFYKIATDNLALLFRISNPS